mmetsp:Transcript_90809/g.228381  ORF Transcript_90809/g.228381 Transcript_90809/m.228381 type:complete len:201 (-) Transcript_90809:68-670(-)
MHWPLRSLCRRSSLAKLLSWASRCSLPRSSLSSLKCAVPTKCQDWHQIWTDSSAGIWTSGRIRAKVIWCSRTCTCCWVAPFQCGLTAGCLEAMRSLARHGQQCGWPLASCSLALGTLLQQRTASTLAGQGGLFLIELSRAPRPSLPASSLRLGHCGPWLHGKRWGAWPTTRPSLASRWPRSCVRPSSACSSRCTRAVSTT